LRFVRVPKNPNAKFYLTAVLLLKKMRSQSSGKIKKLKLLIVILIT
jgi:hypothetical protein